jgi:catalase
LIFLSACFITWPAGNKVDYNCFAHRQRSSYEQLFFDKKNQGIEVERRSTYKYQSLAYSFINRKAEPFIVTVGPKPYTENLFNEFTSGTGV